MPGVVPATPFSGYAELESEEIIALLPDLDASQLERLREHESQAAARPTVLAAIARRLTAANTPA